ncbi:DNA helicase UvrA [Enterococcus hirae]|nr:DNA helicase UvrA [Enterococcus hirae]
MKKERLAVNFWGRPLERKEYEFAVSITCDCDELAKKHKNHLFVCSNCGAVYELIDRKFFQKKDTLENKML